MPFQRGEFGRGCYFPNLERLVVTGRGQLEGARIIAQVAVGAAELHKGFGLAAQAAKLLGQTQRALAPLQGLVIATLAQMKPGAMLINISRADVVDRAALIEALKSKRLGGFALDPLYEAPGKSDDELLNVVSEQISALDHVVTTETFVYLRLEKQTYAWGVR